MSFVQEMVQRLLPVTGVERCLSFVMINMNKGGTTGSLVLSTGVPFFIAQRRAETNPFFRNILQKRRIHT